MKKTVPSVSQFMISGHPVLSKMKQTLDKHQHILTIVKSVIPENLARQCLGCSVNQYQLTIFSHSAVWISQLRFYQSEILNAVNDSQSGFHFSTVKFRVMVTQTGASQATTSTRNSVPSDYIIDMIEDSAKHLTDQQLGEKLKRLAQTLRSKRA